MQSIEEADGAIGRTAAYFPGVAGEPQRFYAIEELAQTDLVKISLGGMLSHRYFNVTQNVRVDVKPETIIEAIARGLRGKAFG